MKNIVFLIFFALILSSCGGEKNRKVEIQTSYGNMTIELFNSTPKHRDNFVKLVSEGFYDDLLFHRVINNFMIQGGDPQSKGASMDTPLGGGGPGYRLPAEIGEKHFKGRLAAARTGDAGNLERESSGSQFYIVDGNPANDASLDGFASSNNVVYTPEDREIYKTVGGTPFLDGQYTVFGQVTEGLDVIDKIASVQTTKPGDRPVQDVKMKIVLLN